MACPGTRQRRGVRQASLNLTHKFPRMPHNPEGIASLSPGLRRQALPWVTRSKISTTPTGLCQRGDREDATPLGLRRDSARFPGVAPAAQPRALGRNPVGIPLCSAQELCVKLREGCRTPRRCRVLGHGTTWHFRRGHFQEAPRADRTNLADRKLRQSRRVSGRKRFRKIIRVITLRLDLPPPRPMPHQSSSAVHSALANAAVALRRACATDRSKESKSPVSRSGL